MDTIELPFKAEYAKSGKAICKGCKSAIDKNLLRIATIVQSEFYDGKQSNWFHEACFFEKQRPESAGDIENFESLRYEDQERIKKTIDELGSGVVPAATEKGKKRSKEVNVANFAIEYANTDGDACQGCEQKFLKNQVCIRKTVFDNKVEMKNGDQALLHHVECFAKMCNELGRSARGDNLPGFKSLSKDDQEAVKDALCALQSEDVPEAKKAKLEKKDESGDAADEKIREQIKAQNKALFKIRDNVKEKMQKPDILSLLEDNNQAPFPGDKEKLYDQIADMLAFGAIQPCKACKSNQFIFKRSGYMCNGQLTESTKCMQIEKDPKRKPVTIGQQFISKYSFLKDVKKKVETRVIQYIAPSPSTIAKNVAMKKKDEIGGNMVNPERPPMYLFQFVQVGLKDSEADLKKRISKLGGKLESKITEQTIAIISTPADVKKMSSRMIKAKEMGIHVVPLEFLNAVEEDPSAAVRLITSTSICDWGTDPSTRIPQEETSAKSNICTKSVPKSDRLTFKDGLAVDPDSGLEHEAHVYVDGKDKYSVVLGLADIQQNENSYYKLQLLKSDYEQKFWVFRSWGRIEASVGGKKLQVYSTIDSAKKEFLKTYLNKTGNLWQNREQFKMIPGKKYPINVEFSDKNGIDPSAEHCVSSNLETPVQDL